MERSAQEAWNQVITGHYSVTMVIRMAWDFECATEASRRIVAVARKHQQANTTHVTEGFDLAIVHRYIARLILQAGGLQQIEDTNKAGTDAFSTGEAMLRSCAMFGLRVLTCSRQQDTYGFLRGVERFTPPGSDWDTCTAVDIWYHDTKDTKSAAMNQHERANTERQQGKFSSMISIQRPTGLDPTIQPDYFTIMATYQRMTADRDMPQLTTNLNGRVVHLRGNFVGLSTSRAHRNVHLQISTCSTLLMKLLQHAGAAPQTSTKLTARHLRHSALSAVHHWVGTRDDRKSKMDEALRRARHSAEVFKGSYLVDLPPTFTWALDQTTDPSTLEQVLLSAAEPQTN